MMPKFKANGEQDYVSFVPNEEFGLHIKDKPVIIDLDEYMARRTSRSRWHSHD